MHGLARVIAMAAAITLAVPAVVATAQVPLRAFGQLPDVDTVRVSPDGSKYAAVMGDENGRQIQIRATGSNALIAVSRAGTVKVRDLQWVGDGHLLTTSSSTTAIPGLFWRRDEWLVGMLYDLGTKRWGRTMEGPTRALNVIAGDPVVATIDGKLMLVVPGISFPENQGVLSMMQMKPDTRYTKIADAGEPNTIDWVIGLDGKAVARADNDRERGIWTLFLRHGTSWKRSYSEAAPIDYPSLLGLGRDGKSVLISTLAGGDWTTREIGIADGVMSPPIVGLNDAGIVRDPATRTMIGTVTSTMDGVDYSFFNESDQRLWKGVRKAFAGEVVTLQSWSDDQQKIVVEVQGDTNGDAFYLVDRTSRTADWMADRYKGIAPGQTAPRRVIRYAAADGMEIPAYLTLPLNRAAKALPLIVLPHGGPASRDDPGFDWWSQALASRGYAVLQPQFRGSDGFGLTHLEAGYGQWGRRMQTDLSDGVRQLVKDGTVDAARVCIAGGSYGGYAALAGVALDPGVYRCASAVAGVTDLRRFLRWSEVRQGGRRNSTIRYWHRFMGAAKTGDKALDMLSPAMQAAAVKVPVQLIHGKDDTVVPFEQSQVMADALKKAGAPVELVTLAAEDHWLSRSATRIQMLEAMVAFLEKHNPPGAADR